MPIRNTLFWTMVSFALMMNFALAGFSNLDWDIDVPSGGWDNRTFTLFDDVSNQTCSLSLTGDLVETVVVSNIPSSLNFTDNQTHSINPFIHLSDSASGSYSGDIKYCNALIDVDMTVNVTSSPNSGSGSCNINKDIFIDTYGQKVPGGRLLFYLRNSTYYAVSGTIAITPSTAGNPSTVVECPGGFCEYQIPPNEAGPVVAKVEIPNCGFKPVQISLSGDGSFTPILTGSKMLSLDVPSDIIAGESFTIMVRSDGNLIDGAVIKVVGVSNDYRNQLPTDSFGGATFKLTANGQYRVFAEKSGYNTTETTISVNLPACKFECCVGEVNYADKACDSGYVCSKDNVCQKKIKKPLLVSCPQQIKKNEQVICSLTDAAGVTLTDISMEGNIVVDNATTIPINFVEGAATFKAPENSFTVKAQETENYQSAVWAYTYPVVNYLLWTAIGGAGFLVLTVGGIMLLRRKGKVVSAEKANMKPAEMSVTMSFDEFKKIAEGAKKKD